MNKIFSLIIPGILCLTACIALYKRIDVYSALIHGADEGLKITARILPPLITLLSAVYMLRYSGVLDAVTAIVSPVLNLIGIPSETVSLMLLRPFSGSGALALGSELMGKYGPDSLIGRTAAVMLSSTETTFYVVGVYFGAAKIKNTRHTIPSAIAADIAGFITAALTVQLFWG